MITRIKEWLTQNQRLREEVQRLEMALRHERDDSQARLARVLTAHNKLESQLEAERARRALTWPRPAQRLTSAEVRDEFAVDITEPWYTAVHQELDDAIADLLDEVTQAPSATLTTERRTHLAGGAEALREFQRRLLELRAAAATDGGEDEQDKD